MTWRLLMPQTVRLRFCRATTSAQRTQLQLMFTRGLAPESGKEVSTCLSLPSLAKCCEMEATCRAASSVCERGHWHRGGGVLQACARTVRAGTRGTWHLSQLAWVPPWHLSDLGAWDPAQGCCVSQSKAQLSILSNSAPGGPWLAG